jgi:cell division protein FtsA
MDTRIGYPNEHLAGNSDEEISSPLYATAVGLVMNSIENNSQSAIKMQTTAVPEKVTYFREPLVENTVEPLQEVFVQTEKVLHAESKNDETTENKIRKSFFDKYVDKIKDFLDNAE